MMCSARCLHAKRSRPREWHLGLRSHRCACINTRKPCWNSRRIIRHNPRPPSRVQLMGTFAKIRSVLGLAARLLPTRRPVACCLAITALRSHRAANRLFTCGGAHCSSDLRNSFLSSSIHGVENSSAPPGRLQTLLRCDFGSSEIQVIRSCGTRPTTSVFINFVIDQMLVFFSRLDCSPCSSS